MTEEQKKRLLDYLEEPEVANLQSLMNGNTRTFTDARDLDALRRKLVGKGDWDEFEAFATVIYKQQEMFLHRPLINWLMDPTRFCSLVVGYLESKEGK